MLGSRKFRKLVAKLYALADGTVADGTDNAGERKVAWAKLDALLLRHGKSRDDIPELIRPEPTGTEPDDDLIPIPGLVAPDPVSLVRHQFARHLAAKPPELLAMALWAVGTHVFDRFTIFPRLFFTAPVRGCGKTTGLLLLEQLAANARRFEGVTAAATFRLIDLGPLTLLVDEADNLDLQRNGMLRTVFNSGHRRGGSIPRVVNGQVQSFATFAPLAIAAIGSVPLPLLDRSIVIHLERYDGVEPLQPFDVDDPRTARDLGTVCRCVFAWARDVTLNLNPELPAALRNRRADNWRPLISVADACGLGAAAREAALALSRGHRDEDAGVVLLRDIRNVFDLRKTDRLASVTLVEDLNGLEDGLWSAWRGIRDNQPPRRFSQTALAHVLGPFRIHPQSIWPPQRNAVSKSRKGYLRSQFEPAWHSYLPGE